MSQNIGGMASFMNNMPPVRGQNPMYYPPCSGMEPHPHPMLRPPYFPEEKMNHCSSAALNQQHMRYRMGMGEFKPPMMGGVVEPAPPPPAKKKRRTSNSNAAVGSSMVSHAPPPSVQDLAPPPLTGYGDTIVASNPFDDSAMAGSGRVCGVMSPMNCGGPPVSPRHPGARSPMCPTSPAVHHRSSPLVDCRKGSPNHPGNLQPDVKGPPVNANGGMVSGVVRPPPASHHPPPPHHPHPPSLNMSNIPPSIHPIQQGYHPPQKPMPPVSAAKVYPVDQPMVFNPQNPNAPPIYPCGVCHKEVHDNDQAILCESGCNFWFHRMCTGLTEGAYQLLTAEVYAEWVCDKCLSTKSIPLVKLKP